MKNVDLGLLVLRVAFGVMMALHGAKKIKGGVKNTAGWFGSIGMKPPMLQAQLAIATEIGAGVLFALGLATPLAAAALISLMIVAIVVAHRKNGFFIFNPGQGWEYCAMIAAAAFAVGAIGAGRWSIDHSIHKDVSGWTGALIAGLVGIGGAALLLATCWRPPKPAAS